MVPQDELLGRKIYAVNVGGSDRLFRADANGAVEHKLQPLRGSDELLRVGLARKNVPENLECSTIILYNRIEYLKGAQCLKESCKSPRFVLPRTIVLYHF